MAVVTTTARDWPRRMGIEGAKRYAVRQLEDLADAANDISLRAYQHVVVDAVNSGAPIPKRGLSCTGREGELAEACDGALARIEAACPEGISLPPAQRFAEAVRNGEYRDLDDMLAGLREAARELGAQGIRQDYM